MKSSLYQISDTILPEYDHFIMAIYHNPRAIYVLPPSTNFHLWKSEFNDTVFQARSVFMNRNNFQSYTSKQVEPLFMSSFFRCKRCQHGPVKLRGVPVRVCVCDDHFI